MKKMIIISIVFFVQMTLFAQTEYQQAMQAALADFGKSQSMQEMTEAANQFERIATVHEDEWLPLYYVGWINSIQSFSTQDPGQRQKYIDNAQEKVEKAMKITQQESELHTLQGMIYQAYIMIDPVSNGQAYTSKSNGSFQTAIKLNPENPRPYYLQALNTLYMPVEYGGGKKAALPQLEQAMKLFEHFSPKTPLHPDWGKDDCEREIIAAKQE